MYPRNLSLVCLGIACVWQHSAKADTCDNKPFPSILGEADGDTFFHCSAIFNTDFLLIGGESSSPTLTTLGTGTFPIFVVYNLSGTFGTYELANVIEVSGY